MDIRDIHFFRHRIESVCANNYIFTSKYLMQYIIIQSIVTSILNTKKHYKIIKIRVYHSAIAVAVSLATNNATEFSSLGTSIVSVSPSTTGSITSPFTATSSKPESSGFALT